ncbi:MAG: Card1-like endonuclease domain-containing protein [bacterium]
MNKIIVSLVSDQTIPNIIFIKSNHDVAKLVFISTEKMESNKKTEWIQKSVKIGMDNCKIKIETIMVHEDNIVSIKEELNNKLSCEKEDNILVNLTCGNKIMSLATYEFFKEKSLSNQNQNNIQMYYLNAGNNIFNRIFPATQNNNSQYDLQGDFCNIKEYLTAYSIEQDKQKTPMRYFEQTRKFYKEIFELEKGAIKNLYALRNKMEKSKEWEKKLKSDSPLEESYIKSFTNFNNETASIYNLFEKTFGDKQFTKNRIKYLTGGWFEEYVYLLIKRGLKLSDDNIYLGVEIENKSLSDKKTNNEIDVIFINKNKLFVIECKTGLTTKDGTSIFSDVIYKQAALRKYFGLTAKSYLFIPEAIKSDKNRADRAEVFSIDIVDNKEMLLDEDKFKKEFLDGLR